MTTTAIERNPEKPPIAKAKRERERQRESLSYLRKSVSRYRRLYMAEATVQLCQKVKQEEEQYMQWKTNHEKQLMQFQRPGELQKDHHSDLERFGSVKMLKSLVARASSAQKILTHAQFQQQRGLHTRNKMAMEYIAKGWNALKEVDRVIDYCEPRDKRLIPHLKTAKDNFEMALEVDNTNTHARYWLSRLHLKYHVPGQCKAIGAALLVEAADMGDADAQYELGRNLRIENEGVHTDQQAFYYLEKAADQLQPDALYLLGAVYLTGDCVKKDVASALWCFYRASDKPLKWTYSRFNLNDKHASRKTRKKTGGPKPNLIELAREQFENAAKLGNDLGFRWLKRLDEEEKRLLAA
ncbi:Sel1-like protein [Tanacetum coccineum]